MSNWSTRLDRRLALLRQVQSLADLALLVRICWFASRVECLVRGPLARLVARLEPRRTPPAPDVERERRVIRLVEGVLRASRPFIRPRCLHRGLTLYFFLRRAGAPVTLCFGMGTPGSGSSGHCWLERDAEPYLEPEDPRSHYVVMYRLPHPRA